MINRFKFRAWDKKNNKWVDDVDIAINQRGELFIRPLGFVNFCPMGSGKSKNFKIIFSQ